LAYCVVPAVSAILGAITLYYMKHGSKTLVDRVPVANDSEKQSLLQNDTVYGTA
ncbi:hypothetical protein DYB37_008129, partial [Aphanomyces astaci]